MKASWPAEVALLERGPPLEDKRVAEGFYFTDTSENPGQEVVSFQNIPWDTEAFPGFFQSKTERSHPDFPGRFSRIIPARVAGSQARARWVKLPVALDPHLPEPFELCRSNALLFKHPTQALGGCGVQPESMVHDAVQVQLGSPGLERVKDLREVSTVLGHGQAVEQGAFGIGDRYARLCDPDVFSSEESIRLDLNEPVEYVANRIAARDLLRPCAPESGNGSPYGRRHKDVPRRLLRQTMMVQSRPVADGGRADQRHRNFKLVRGSSAGSRGRDGIQSSMHRHNPSVSAEVIKRLPKISLLEAHAGTELPGAFHREDPIAFRVQEPDEFNSHV